MHFTQPTGHYPTDFSPMSASPEFLAELIAPKSAARSNRRFILWTGGHGIEDANRAFSKRVDQKSLVRVDVINRPTSTRIKVPDWMT